MKNQYGRPTRTSILPEDSEARKAFPLATGLMDYFPDALAAVANVSHEANEQHNPGQPVAWSRKSREHADALLRHFSQRGQMNGKIRHSAQVAWRALAILQEELEAEQQLKLAEEEWPKYYLCLTPDWPWVYRAVSNEDVGQFWRRDKWNTSPGCAMELYFQLHQHNWKRLTREEARAAGADVTI